MEFPRPTLNGILVLAFGVILASIGVYFCVYSWTRVLGIGLLLIGVGLISMGITNGFSDYSPLGRLLYKFGLLGFAGGVPLFLYAFYNGAF